MAINNIFSLEDYITLNKHCIFYDKDHISIYMQSKINCSTIYYPFVFNNLPIIIYFPGCNKDDFKWYKLYNYNFPHYSFYL